MGGMLPFDFRPVSAPPITFVAFVVSLTHTAAVHFGDVADPVTGARGEPNLLAAKQIIDILALLDTKTRGNLTVEERRLLEGTLEELRARYERASSTPAASRQTLP
jgi:hypothetical protein